MPKRQRRTDELLGEGEVELGELSSAENIIRDGDPIQNLQHIKSSHV